MENIKTWYTETSLTIKGTSYKISGTVILESSRGGSFLALAVDIPNVIINPSLPDPGIFPLVLEALVNEVREIDTRAQRAY